MVKADQLEKTKLVDQIIVERSYLFCIFKEEWNQRRLFLPMIRNLHIMRICILSLVLFGSTLATGQFVDVTNDKNFVPAKSSPLYGSGVAAADYDDDGDIDLFVCTDQGYPNYLYQNNGGNFASIGEVVGLGSMERSRMALWLDIDGDADLDLLVSGDCNSESEDCFEDTESRIHLYQQENGIFSEITIQAGLTRYGPKRNSQVVGGLAAADINNDGFVDIVLTIWKGPIEAFINDGNGVFEEQSKSLGLDIGLYNYWQPFFHDFNSDGYIDIYCNVDFEGNQFWINSAKGSFVESSEITNSNNAFNEMGISLGDIDNDGDFDIYSTNIANYNGQDVHNILLQQNQNANSQIFFTEIAKNLGIDQGGWGWGATFFDSNNDGLIDLATTNGWSVDYLDHSKIWIQQPDRTFSDQSFNLSFNDNLNGASLISLDYDRDGDLDMIQSIKGFEGEMVPIRLMENQISSFDVGHYLVVKPRMNGSNHFSIGSTVTAYVNGNIYTRIIHAGTSFYGQEPAEAFLGLGQADRVDSLNITWPGGEVSWWYNIDADQLITLDDSQVVHRPGGFKAEQVGREIFLSWYDVSTTESGFLLQRSISMDFDSYSEISLPANTNSYIDSDALMDGTYFYKLKAYNNDFSSRFTDVLQIQNIVLSTDEKSPNDIIIYPNPTSSILNVRLDQKITSVKLFTMDGVEIKLYNHQLGSQNSVQLELKNIRHGIYFLKINSIVRRIIVK